MKKRNKRAKKIPMKSITCMAVSLSQSPVRKLADRLGIGGGVLILLLIMVWTVYQNKKVTGRKLYSPKPLIEAFTCFRGEGVPSGYDAKRQAASRRTCPEVYRSRKGFRDGTQRRRR